MKMKMKRNEFTRGFAAGVAQKSGHLFHLHELPAGGTESVRLENGCGGDEGAIIPEANRVCHRRITLGEEVLELVGLEEVGNGLVAAIFGPAFTFPPFVTHLESSLQHLHQWLRP